MYSYIGNVDYSKYTYTPSFFGSGGDLQYYPDPLYDENGSEYDPSSWKIAPGFEYLYPGSQAGETLPEYYSRFASEGLNADFLDLLGLGDKSTPTPTYTPSKPIDYLNADLAKAYGMDATTAYQEALSNTSYQRAVADLKAAGLNPVLAASGLGGASGVYSAKNGTGVSYGSGVSSGHDAYNFMKNVFTIVGALAGYSAGGIKGAVSGAKVAGDVGGSLGNLIDGA